MFLIHNMHFDQYLMNFCGLLGETLSWRHNMVMWIVVLLFYSSGRASNGHDITPKLYHGSGQFRFPKAMCSFKQGLISIFRLKLQWSIHGSWLMVELTLSTCWWSSQSFKRPAKKEPKKNNEMIEVNTKKNESWIQVLWFHVITSLRGKLELELFVFSCPWMILVTFPMFAS